MQSDKPLVRAPRITPKIIDSHRINKPTTPTAKMSVFFPRSGPTSDQGFTPLFRLLEDFDSFKNAGEQSGRGTRGHLPAFQPKFDVRETGDAYELHGELPGMNKNDVHIDFSDPQTMTIRGRVERSYQGGTPPAGAIEEKKTQGITEGGEDEARRHRHQASVEDEEFTEVTPVSSRDEKKPSKDTAKYWVSERSIGEFSRSFNFPGHVDTDSVSASLRDGILNVTVPKAKKTAGRRIRVD